MARLRLTTIFALLALCLISYLVFTSTTRQPILEQPPDEAEAPSRFTEKLPSFAAPDFHFTFRTSAHKPPEQQDSANGETRWYSDWKWLNPFSSSITLDENRAVLPPLQMRTPVYTYYDTTTKRDKETREVDRELLLTWRRAWWAYGFRPVILGPADAQQNPLYESLQIRNLDSTLEFEFARFLAWGHMGTGLLASYHCFPMGEYEDPLLSFLRRGEFPELIRFEKLGAGLFASRKLLMNDAAQDAMEHAKLNDVSSIIEAIPPQRFTVEKPVSIAHYDSNAITAKYPRLATKLVETPNEGRRALIELINAHLHLTWQNSFPKGITVLKPLPKHTTALVEPSAQLANLLTECPETILPSSCPPNKPNCSPCVAAQFRITVKAAFRNTSDEFTIGTLPHPYTLIMLNNQSDSISVGHIRRYTKRDPWLVESTSQILGSSRGGPSRLVAMKEAVASESGISRGLWLTVEQLPATASARTPTDSKRSHNLPEEFLEELDWFFGFPIPRSQIAKGESETPVPGPERRPKFQPGLPEPKRKSWDVDPPDEKALSIEIELLGRAREVIKSKDARITRIKEVAEKWNLADTEAWHFVRAWRARSSMEREKWDEEEKGFGVDGSAKGSTRWFV